MIYDSTNKIFGYMPSKNPRKPDTNIYLFFSPSFGLLIVNLQSDARKEFKGSIARRTPQA